MVDGSLRSGRHADDSVRGFPQLIFPGYASRRTSQKDSPAKLANRMKRRWRVVLMRSRGELLGFVDTADAQAAELAAAAQFRLDGWQRRRLLVR